VRCSDSPSWWNVFKVLFLNQGAKVRILIMAFTFFNTCSQFLTSVRKIFSLPCQRMKAQGLPCLLGLFLVMLSLEMLAQDEVIVSGMVLDAQTLEPLPYAHILKNHQSATTPNQSGTFMVRMRHLDTLTISHVSYNAQNHKISKSQNSDTVTLAIFLKSETTLLPELEVTPFPATLGDFKQEIMEIEVRDPVKSLRQQQAAITYDIIMSPKVSYDAYEIYRRISQPTQFTLFSSGGNKGISRVLRGLGIGKNNKK